jgi:DNA-binding NtrC family response regulator
MQTNDIDQAINAYFSSENQEPGEPMHEVLKQVAHYAQSHHPVLITGESGTGKEIAARGIHRHSTRNQQPFITVNCSSFPNESIESELFGHPPRAFSIACSRRQGFWPSSGQA